MHADNLGNWSFDYDAGTPTLVATLTWDFTNHVYDVHTDHLDTPRPLTGASGAPAWQSSHEAYGAAQTNNSPGAGREFNIRFPGQ